LMSCLNHEILLQFLDRLSQPSLSTPSQVQKGFTIAQTQLESKLN
jgi:hypothetical protein